jgi:hypothetical protein
MLNPGKRECTMPDYHLYQIRLDAVERARLPEDRDLASAFAFGRIGQVSRAIDLGLHKFTAVIRARDMEDLFHKTGGIDGSWVEGPKVLRVEPGAQSTSVGDIAVDPETGEAWLCATVGWETLSWDRAERFVVESTGRAEPGDRQLEDACEVSP